MAVNLDDARILMNKVLSATEDLLDVMLQLPLEEVRQLEEEIEVLGEQRLGPKTEKLQEKLYGARE